MSEVSGETQELMDITVELMDAFSKARKYLFASIATSGWHKGGRRRGDGTSAHDPAVFLQFYHPIAEKHGMLVVCEEAVSAPDQRPVLNASGHERVLILDPIDGTRNMMEAMTFGVNMAFGRLRPSHDFTLGDIEGVLVYDYRTRKGFRWIKGQPAFVRSPTYGDYLPWRNFPAESQVYEVPDERSYVSPEYPQGEQCQENLLQLFRTLFPNAQRRAVDCTGARLLEVADGNLLAYGDVRRATSIWDTAPSVKYLIECEHPLVVLSGEFDRYSNDSPLLLSNGNQTYAVRTDFGDTIIVMSERNATRMMDYVKRKRVFVVHGRDSAAAAEIARFIEEELAYECVILKEKSNRSLTIIEKVEEYSDVQAAVVLLTPDDEGRLAHSEDQFRPRARQNVIFELGLFYGLLGRHNVIAMHREVEKPSDIDGVLHVVYEDTGAWKYELKRELEQVGAPSLAPLV